MCIIVEHIEDVVVATPLVLALSINLAAFLGYNIPTWAMLWFYFNCAWSFRRVILPVFWAELVGIYKYWEFHSRAARLDEGYVTANEWAGDETPKAKRHGYDTDEESD